MDNQITFITSDQVALSANENIRKMLKAPCMNFNQVTLPEINSKLLTLILEYCYYHNFTDPPKIKRSSQMNDLKECLQDEADFKLLAKVANEGDYEGVANLLIAANLLECAGLEDLCYTYLGFYFRCIIYFDDSYYTG
jgi:hypothetical protein